MMSVWGERATEHNMIKHSQFLDGCWRNLSLKIFSRFFILEFFLPVFHFLNNCGAHREWGCSSGEQLIASPAAACGTHALALPVLACYNLASRGLLGKVVAAEHFVWLGRVYKWICWSWSPNCSAEGKTYLLWVRILCWQHVSTSLQEMFVLKKQLFFSCLPL